MNDTEPRRSEIPLQLATLSDIAAELDRRTNPAPYVLIRRAANGSWVGMCDGITMPEAAEMLGECKRVAEEIDFAPGKLLKGFRGKRYFYARATSFHGAAPRSRLRSAVNPTFWFFLGAAVAQLCSRVFLQ